MSRSRVVTGLLALALAALLAAPALSVAAARSRASFTDIENDLMCVACREPLAVANSPEAYSERQYIRTLILQGETKKQIENDMVAQYGPAVLALPPAHGFNIVVYVLPPVLVAAGVALLAFTIPKWRRRAREAPSELPSREPLAAADAQRLNEELARER